MCIYAVDKPIECFITRIACSLPSPDINGQYFETVTNKTDVEKKQDHDWYASNCTALGWGCHSYMSLLKIFRKKKSTHEILLSRFPFFFKGIRIKQKFPFLFVPLFYSTLLSKFSPSTNSGISSSSSSFLPSAPPWVFCMFW